MLFSNLTSHNPSKTFLGTHNNLMNFQNIDSAIFKRIARIFKTHEFRIALPEAIFEKTELVYNPKTGLDVASTDNEGEY